LRKKLECFDYSFVRAAMADAVADRGELSFGDGRAEPLQSMMREWCAIFASALEGRDLAGECVKDQNQASDLIDGNGCDA
jgi:hypothetical protein